MRQSKPVLRKSTDAGTASKNVNAMSFGHILARIILKKRRQNNVENFEKWWAEALAIDPNIAEYKRLFASAFYVGAAYGSECGLERVQSIFGGKK